MSMLDGQWALVTGASRGIGRAIAETLARDGARVVGTATSAAGAEAISGWLGASGGRGAVLDVSNPAAIDSLVAELEAAGSAPSILVNNAAITRDMLLLRMKPEEWDQVIATNLSSVFRLSKACLRKMLKDRAGRIISITSIVGAIGNPGQTNYAAAKAGVIGFTKSLAREVATRGVLVNAIAPGPIETPLLASETEEWRSAKLAELPIGRFGTVDEVTPTAVLLASAEGSYYVGATLGPNGGDVML